jgi:ABC-type multidrug transport system ATPase subunit
VPAPGDLPAGFQLRNLSVIRSGARVLDQISLEVRRGEIVAIIGPNGAGKTTLLEAAIGAAPLAEGMILVDGRAPRNLSELARVFAFVAGEAEPPHEARAATLLSTGDGGGADLAWRAEVEARLGLGSFREARVGTLSRGERRRLLLHEALTGGKPFLLLDEPTGVFDPLQLQDVVSLFRSVAQRGAGLLVSVHQMSDAEALGARLVILNRGRVVAAGSLDDLRSLAALASAASLQDVFLALLRRSDFGQDRDARA